jgi:hypothetical protein
MNITSTSLEMSGRYDHDSLFEQIGLKTEKDS